MFEGERFTSQGAGVERGANPLYPSCIPPKFVLHGLSSKSKFLAETLLKFLAVVKQPETLPIRWRLIAVGLKNNIQLHSIEILPFNDKILCPSLRLLLASSLRNSKTTQYPFFSRG